MISVVATTLGCAPADGVGQARRDGSQAADPPRFDIEVGFEFSCLHADDAVTCWGRVPGLEAEPVAEPVPVPLDPDRGAVVDIAAGYSQLCLVYEDGSVDCEPDLAFHRLDPAIAAQAVDVMYAWEAACVVDVDGIAHCVDPSQDRRYTPLSAEVSSLAAGPGEACALHPDGASTCWEARDLGPIGLNADVRGAVELSMGWSVACARYPHGGVSCATFDGETGEWSEHAVVAGLRDAHAIRSGRGACAITGGGRVACWGDNGASLLGVPSQGEEDVRELPVEVPGLTGIVDLDLTWDHACAVDGDGVVMCWGANGASQLGTNILLEHP